MADLANASSSSTATHPDPSRPALSREGMARKTQSFTLGAVEIATIVTVGPILLALYWVNYAQLNEILGILFGRDGSGQDGMHMVIAASLIGLGGYCFLLAGKMHGAGRALAFVIGLALGGVSAWSSIVYFAHQGNAEVAKETEASTLFKLNTAEASSDRRRVALARQGVNDARRAKGVFMEGAAQGNAAEQGQLYRDRMAGLDAGIAMALAELHDAEAAANMSTGRARDTLEGGVAGPLAKSLESFGSWVGLGEAEATSRAAMTGTVISVVPSFILLLIGLYLREEDDQGGKITGGSDGDGGERADAAGEGGDTVRDLHPQGRGVRNTGYSAPQLAAMASHVVGTVPSKDGSVSIASIIEALRNEDDGTSIGKGAAAKVQARVEDLLDARRSAA